MTPYEELKNKIVERVPEIKCPYCNDEGFKQNSLERLEKLKGSVVCRNCVRGYRPITLEDVLKVIFALKTLIVNGYEIELSSHKEEGEFLHDFISRWKLGKPLKDKSEETLEFINSIL